MAKKSFKGYTPAEAQVIELESPDGSRKIEVRGRPSVAGSVILDFLAEIDSDDPSTLATAVNRMLRLSIADESWDEFKSFVDDEDNGISLEILSEIAGFFAESFSGKAPAQPVPSSAI